jgi:hypothetical protein
MNRIESFGTRFPAVDSRDIQGPKPAMLMPIPQPLWDMEIMPRRKTPKDITFFQRGMSQMTAYGGHVKAKEDTNMVMAGQLPAPNVFKIAGFNLFIEPNATHEDWKAVLGGMFQFCFGPRIYFQNPIRNMPLCVGREEHWKLLAHRKVKSVGAGYHVGSRVLEDAKARKLENLPVPFHVGRHTFTLLPGECFGVHLSWPRPPKISRDLRLWVTIEGMLFFGL